MKPSEYDALSDEQLAELFKTRRDQVAFEALVCRHEPGVLRFCLRLLTRNKEAARDTSQVVFTRVARHIGTFRGENFAGWMFRIMRNECMNVLARERGTERKKRAEKQERKRKGKERKEKTERNGWKRLNEQCFL